MARNIVTVLFADIADKTSLYARLGDWLARQAVDNTQKLMSLAVAASDGRVADTEGDEMVAIFGSADQAVQAAMTIQKENAECNQERRYPVTIRAAMHTGQALIEGGGIYGDVINTVARLNAITSPGQTLASAATINALKDDWTNYLRVQGPQTLRGKRDSVHLTEVIWCADDVRAQTTVQPQNTISGVALSLRLGSMKHVRVDDVQPRCTVGRAAENTLTVPDQRASRVHAEIEYRAGQFVLNDRSTNGTHLAPDGGDLQLLRREQAVLTGKGLISLGREPGDRTAETVIEYEIK